MSTAAIEDPRSLAIDGERIYAERYKDGFEAKYAGQFAAISLKSGAAFVSEFPEEAIERARANDKDSLIHLVRIGSPSAYRMSFFFASDDASLARAL